MVVIWLFSQKFDKLAEITLIATTDVKEVGLYIQKIIVKLTLMMAA